VRGPGDSVTGYSVLAVAFSDGTGDVDEAAAHRLIEELAADHGVVGWGGDPDRWEARITIDAADGVIAMPTAIARIVTAADKAGMPAWRIVHVEVTAEEAQDQIDRAGWPDLVSVPEAAEILGVSPQRVHVLARENSSFPRPAYALRSGKIWLRGAVERFAETWERKPGRPRKDQGAA
jgi:hypothetical protein